MKNLYEKYPVIHLNGGGDITRGENKPFIPKSRLINPGRVAKPPNEARYYLFHTKKL